MSKEMNCYAYVAWYFRTHPGAYNLARRKRQKREAWLAPIRRDNLVVCMLPQRYWFTRCS